MSSRPKPPSDRWALLIGINQYRHDSHWNLMGAVHDVEVLAEHLRRRWYFRPNTILQLTDAAATRSGIREGMRWLEHSVRPGDQAVFFYSGHGSWRPDEPGSKRRADGREKTLVPHDSGRGSRPNLDLGGDELHEWLQTLTQKAYVTVILDCCHSGTLTREILGSRPRQISSDAMLPAADPDAAADSSSGWFPPGGDYVLIAACRSDQVALEMPVDDSSGEKGGLLSHYLLRRLEACAADSSYQDLVDAVRKDLSKHFRDRPPQEPQVEGARDRQIFGRRLVPTLRYVQILERLGPDELVVAAGAAHSIHRGAPFEVYPLGTQRALTPDGESTTRPAIGRARFTAVGSTCSRARILSESPDRPIRSGDRAVLQRSSGAEPEDLRLAVRLEVPNEYSRQAAAFGKRIEQSPLLRLAGAQETGELTVMVPPCRERAGPGDALPCLGRIQTPAWIITRDRRTPLAPIRPLGQVGALDFVLDNLEKRARWLRLLDLENPQSPLSDKVSFTLKRQKRGRWEPIDRAEEPTFRAEERFAFEIVNGHNAPLFAYVLDLGLGGGISLLHPTRLGAREPLKPERAVEVGTRRARRFVLPRGYPYFRGCKSPDGREREILKMIVTTESTDFRIFFQESCRRLPPLADLLRSELGRLLSFAAFGSPCRGSGEPEHSTDDPWTTVERPVWVTV